MEKKKLYPSTVQARKRKALLPEDIDKLGQAILTLTQELWAVRDRQIIVEQVLKEKGIDISESVDKYIPSHTIEETLKTSRQNLIKKILQDISGEYEPLDKII
ncbi:MAG: hypothetical protein CMM25_00910 [Rhodospirillaceae bacterium]|nr:hypothetical protein [Rhodospirillaceae bacterium]